MNDFLGVLCATFGVSCSTKCSTMWTRNLFVSLLSSIDFEFYDHLVSYVTGSSRCSPVSMLRSLCSPVLCSPVSMLPSLYVPRFYVPRYLCSPVLCSPVPMFPDPYVPQYLCSPIPMFPGTYLPRFFFFLGGGEREV